MAVARTGAVALTGIHGQLVEVEVDVTPGLPKFLVVGLPDASVNEARDRVRAAVVNSGLGWPDARITVNLSPAWVKKRGTGFDLAVAAAFLSAADLLPRAAVADLVLIGELGLDGRLRPVRGVLPMVRAAVVAGRTQIVVPRDVAPEAACVPGAEVLAVGTLAELVGVLRGDRIPESVPPPVRPPTDDPDVDLSDVVGQHTARSALEIAAAGGHHLLMHGAPGAGKSMLARRLPGLLPVLTDDEALEVSAIHSVAGMLTGSAPWVTRPPYQAPHHTATAPSMVGGGQGVARPGAVSLAHRGVLFLDEAPEFGVSVIETLRQPLETGEVTIARVDAVVSYPARFLLVLAANPCPCGQSFGKGSSCQCTPAQKLRYRGRLSGPLLDRVDLRVPVAPVDRAALLAGESGEPTALVRQRVLAARERSSARFSDVPWQTNAEIPGRALRHRFRPEGDALLRVSDELGRGRLSARGVDRVLRVAWTIADLAGRDRPGSVEVAAALGLRGVSTPWAA